MAAKPESTKNGTDHKEPAENSAPPPSAKSGNSVLVPVLANLLVMPLLAFALAHFYIIPQLKGEKAGHSAGETKAPESHSKKKESKVKFTAPLSGKILVNVSGTAGTRYLVANMTLVSAEPELKSLVESHDPQLRDAAAGVLSVKTIADLEKPGIRNLIRTEMISIFNDVFGRSIVNEIYLTEFAIQ